MQKAFRGVEGRDVPGRAALGLINEDSTRQRRVVCLLFASLGLSQGVAPNVDASANVVYPPSPDA